MTSAAPAKKPYRKAPPEHRELRLDVPGSQLEQQVSKRGPHFAWRRWASEAGCLADSSRLRGLCPPELGESVALLVGAVRAHRGQP